MPNIWLINQFANTPDLPGHTRQYDIAKYLVEKGWVVEVFASDFNLSERRYTKLNNFQLKKTQIFNGIKWHWLWAAPYKKNNWKRYFNLLSFCIHLGVRIFGKKILLTKFFKRLSKPDIILASSPQLPAAFVCMIFSKILKKPFILEVRDLWPQVLIDQSKSKNSFLIKLLTKMEIKLYQEADHVIVLANGCINYVKDRGAKNVTFLPNGPDLNVFKKVEIPNKNLSFDNENPFKILYSGAHGESNNLSNVLEAAKLLRNMPVVFTFIGDGPEKKILINRSKLLKNVFFKDPIPKSEMPLLISKFDAILVSLKDISLFRYGVSPNKLYDAYAVGRPVISTVSGDINNEIEKFNLGVTAPPNNPKALANAIIKLLKTSINDRICMGNRARSLAENIYSRQIINKSFNTLLKGYL